MSKFIIICGGVISGTGKGVAASSIGLLLRMRGHRVTGIKFDGYIGSASTLSPTEHGEVFLCDDGSETDLDLGYMERLMGINVGKKNICTSGTLMKELITEQENGVYLGSTVQISPHYTQKVHKRLEELSKETDIVVAEIGGTVGDIESAAYYESIREFKQKRPKDVIIIMVAPILWVPTIEEFKTKPLQNSIKELQRNGIQADILLCRVDRTVPEKILDKVSNLTGINRDCVFDAPDVKSIYEVPVEFYNRHLDDICVDLLGLKRSPCRIHKYRDLLGQELKNEITIAVFGKYDNVESYLSIKEALFHSALSNNAQVNIKWVKSDDVEKTNEIEPFFKGIDGLIIPGGFDKRGIDGKIKAIRYAREKKIPFLGICLGLQCAVIEFARNVCNMKEANSQEFDKDCLPVVHYVKGQENIEKKSGTMRLGAYDCELVKGTLTSEVYDNKKIISERHRHRLEVNPEHLDKYAEQGLVVSGVNPGSNLVEMIELKNHPYFIATQAHPEFKIKLADPAPLFKGLVRAGIQYKKVKNDDVK